MLIGRFFSAIKRTRYGFWFLIFLVLVASTVFGLSLIFSNKKAAVPAETSGNAAVNNVGAALREAATRDSDEDGLYDWEELIYGTNPQNPDSDGDGIPDKEAVAQSGGRLRKQGGPAGVADSQYSAVFSDNLTENLFRLMDSTLTPEEVIRLSDNPDLFINNPEKLPAFNSADFNYALKSLLGGARQRFEFVPPAPSSLHVLKNEDQNQRIAYLNAVISLMKRYSRFQEEESVQRIEESIRQSNPKLLADMVKALADAERGLAALEVPESWAEIHGELISLVGVTHKIMRAFQNSGTDPLYAAVGLSQVAAVDDFFGKLSEKINRKLEEQKISL